MLLSELDQPNNNVESDTLIIGLHGYGGNGNQHMADNGLDTITDATVVCPTAPTQDSDSKNQWRYTDTNHDIYFLAGIIAYMIENFNINPDKIHLNGQSQGGNMSYVLASVFPNLFQSVTVTSAFFPLTTSVYQGKVTHIHGELDAIVPISGVETNTIQKLRNGGAKVLFQKVYDAGHSVQNSLDGFATLNEKLAIFNDSVLGYIKRNVGL